MGTHSLRAFFMPLNFVKKTICLQNRLRYSIIVMLQ